MIRSAKVSPEQSREWEMRRRIRELEAELAQAYVALTRLRTCRCMDLYKAVEESTAEGARR